MIPLDRAFIDRPIAHRGWHDPASGRPENSRAAMSGALAMGYAIELDVQLAADNEAVVFHDATLDRLTAETGPVRERTARELAAIPLRGNAPRPQTIPTLAEILGLIRGRTAVLIEIKDQSGRLGDPVGPLEEAVARALSAVDEPRAHAVMSFNPESVAAMARLAPGIARGLTTEKFRRISWGGLGRDRRRALTRIEDFERVGASFISHNRRDLGMARVAELRKAGATILTWTVRTPAEERAARRVAHNITFEGYGPGA